MLSTCWQIVRPEEFRTMEICDHEWVPFMWNRFRSRCSSCKIVRDVTPENGRAGVELVEGV